MLKHFIAIMVLGVLLACSKQDATQTINDRLIDAIDVGAVEGRGANTENWWDKLPRKAWSNYSRVLSEHPWFEVYRIFPDVYAIYEPGQFEEVISFLIIGQEQALLFDTGLGIAALRPVVSALTSLKVTVINSHSHYDHIGGNHEFEHIASIDEPYAHTRALGLPSEQVAEYIAGHWVWKPFPVGFDKQTYAIQPYTISQPLADGLLIDLGGRQLEVIHTPGHSPDSICLLDRENRLLLTGDTFYLAPLYAHLEGSDLGAYMKSAEALAELQPNVDYLLTAHNVPVVDSAYLLKLEHALTRIKEGNSIYTTVDGSLEHEFDDFTIITK